MIHVDLENVKPLLKSLGKEREEKIAKQYETWIHSDFAGFRSVLEANSKEAPNLAEIKKLALAYSVSAKGKAIRNFVLLGIGGSSLGAETLVRALRADLSKPQFFFMDNNDPDFFADHLHFWNAEETLFFVVSKSGATPETIAQFLVCVDWLKSKLTDNDWQKHIVVCTDPEKGELCKLLQTYPFASLPIPSSVGGRFCVFTAVGLFPAAFAELNLEKILSGARSLVQAWEKKSLSENPAYLLANILATNTAEFPISVCLPYSSHLKAFSRWFSQIWAESLGKNKKGMTPYPALGTTDQHSQIQLYMDGPRDKIIGLVEIKEFKHSLQISSLKGTEALPTFSLLQNHSMADLFQAEFRATKTAFSENKIPNFTITLDRLSEENIGALLYFWEWVTVYAGAILDINPFDQPGVEKGKLLTKQFLQ